MKIGSRKEFEYGNNVYILDLLDTGYDEKAQRRAAKISIIKKI